MMRLLGSLSSYYQPRIYIVAETDKMSVEKITTFEKEKTNRGGSEVGINKSLQESKVLILFIIFNFISISLCDLENTTCVDYFTPETIPFF